MNQNIWAWRIGLVGWLIGAIASFPQGVKAQVVPDDTLGAERSQVRPDTIRGVDSDRIEGGARRGQNLFHSFQQFSVQEGRGAYFLNPDGVRNIFSRVTGGGRSDIFGRLGVISPDNVTPGTANLFLINPNGIVFGRNASLDVGGSFVGTTANGLQFGDRGFFNATNPEVPSDLLTIDPSAFLFNQIPATITNSSTDRTSGQDPSNSFNPFGLRVPDGQSFLLLAGDININGGGIAAFGGQIELGSLSGAGLIGVSSSANRFNLDFPSTLPRADVTLTNGAGLIVSTGGGGEIGITARNIDILQGSTLEAGILGNLGSALARAGDITLNSTGAITVANPDSHIYNNISQYGTGIGGNILINADQLRVLDGAEVSANVRGRGTGGNVTVKAADSVEVIGPRREGEGSYITALVGRKGNGTAGNLTIETSRLLVDSAQVSASVFGRGNAGNLTVHASDSVDLKGEIPGGDTNGVPGGLFALVDRNAVGTGGLLTIETGRLNVSDGSKAQAILFGNGTSGNVNISADEIRVFETAQPNNYSTGIFVGAGLDPRNVEVPQGGGGQLSIHANQVSIRGGEISSSTDGGGDAGSILIQARDSVEVIDTSTQTGRNSFIRADVNKGATGQGGDLTIETRNLTVLGSQISASTFGVGNAGNLNIRATNSIVLNGENPGTNGDNGSPGGLFAQVEQTGVGNGGNLRIRTNHLSVSDGSKVQAATFGQGNAGELFIRANAIDVFDTERYNYFSTGIIADVGTDASVSNRPVGTGNGGNITIQTGRLSIRGGQVTADTDGQGNAGTLRIYARDLVEVVGTSARIGRHSFLGADVNTGATGRGGRITLSTGHLSVRDGGRVSVRTFGAGNAGTLHINADAIEVSGRSANGRTPSQLSAAVGENSTGRGGDLILEADNLRLTEGGQISAQTAGQRRAGDIFIQANDSIALANGSISTASTAATRRSTGRGGDITIQTGALEASDRSQITAQSQGNGRAGNITLNASRQLNATDSAIATSAPRSSGGNITLNTGSGTQLQNSNITTSSNSAGGNITLNGNALTRLQNSDITTNSNSGNGGNITLGGSTVALGDSDLLAGSRDQQGGRISLGTFFGEDYRPNAVLPFENNNRVDVNADGGGAPGEISLTDTSFIQNSLNELSVDSINTGALLANSCIVRDRQRGSFRVTGSDNFPERPGNDNASPYPTGTIRSIPTDGSATPQTNRPWQIGDPIVEPQGVYRLPDGRLVMSRECSQSNLESELK